MVDVTYLQAYLEALINELDDAIYEVELALRYLKSSKERLERLKKELKKLTKEK